MPAPLWRDTSAPQPSHSTSTTPPRSGEPPVLPPASHVLPPPPTPEPPGAEAAGAAPAPTPLALDLSAAADWGAEVLAQQPASERRRQQQQQQQQQQQLAPHLLGGPQLTAAPRLPGQLQHVRRRRRGHAGGGDGGSVGHAHSARSRVGHRQRTLQDWVVSGSGAREDSANASSSSDDDSKAPCKAAAAAWPGSSAAAAGGPRQRRGGGGGARRPCRSPRMYRGGRREDDLALHDPGQLLGSEEQDWEGGHAGGGWGGVGGWGGRSEARPSCLHPRPGVSALLASATLTHPSPTHSPARPRRRPGLPRAGGARGSAGGGGDQPGGQRPQQWAGQQAARRGRSQHAAAAGHAARCMAAAPAPGEVCVRLGPRGGAHPPSGARAWGYPASRPTLACLRACCPR